MIALTMCLIVETAPPTKTETGGSAGKRSSRNAAPGAPAAADDILAAPPAADDLLAASLQAEEDAAKNNNNSCGGPSDANLARILQDEENQAVRRTNNGTGGLPTRRVQEEQDRIRNNRRVVLKANSKPSNSTDDAVRDHRGQIHFQKSDNLFAGSHASPEHRPGRRLH
jgi:hypothetical protein